MQSQPSPSFTLTTTCSTATTLWLLLLLYSQSQLTSAAAAPAVQEPGQPVDVVIQNGSYLPQQQQQQQNQQQQQQDMKLPVYLRVLATLASVLIFTVGVCGNLLVPLVVIKTKYLRNSTNLFLINLSVADLLVLIVCMPTVLVELHSRPETWSLGEPMCKLSNYVEMLAANGSIFTILAISFERYYAICEPLKAGYKCTRLRATIIICLIWLLSSLLTSPILLMAKSLETIYIDGSLVNNCILETDTYWNKVYVFVSMIFFFCLPLLVLVLVYWLIARRLTRENLAMSSTNSTSLTTSSADSSSASASYRASSSGRLLAAQNLFSSFQYRRPHTRAAAAPEVHPSLAKSFTCGTTRGSTSTGSWAPTIVGPNKPRPAGCNKALSLDDHLMEINKLTSSSKHSNGDSFLTKGLTDTRDNHLSTICERGPRHRKEATIREEEEGEGEGEEDEEDEDGGQARGRGQPTGAEPASLMARLVYSILGKRGRCEHKSIKRKNKSFHKSGALNPSSLERWPANGKAAAYISSTTDTCSRQPESSSSASGHEPLLPTTTTTATATAQLKGFGRTPVPEAEANTGAVITKLAASRKHSRFNWVRGFSVSSSSAASMHTNCTSLLFSEPGGRTSRQESEAGANNWQPHATSEVDGARQDDAAKQVAYFARPDAGAPDSCLDSLPGSTCSSESCSPDPISTEVSSSTQQPPPQQQQQQHFNDSMMLKVHDNKQQQHPNTCTHSSLPTANSGEASFANGGLAILSLKNCSESDRVRKEEHKPTLITDYCDTATLPFGGPTSGADATATLDETMLQRDSSNTPKAAVESPESQSHSAARSRARVRLMKLGGANSLDTTHASHLYPNPTAAKLASINKRRSQPNVQVYQQGHGQQPQLTELMVMQNLSKKQQMDSRRQVVMMLAFVVTCFFLLFFPYRVFTIWLILSTEEQVQSLGMETYYNLTYFSRILIYLHSAINPIVYNLISTKFRRAFTSLLFCQGSGSRRKFTNANYATNHKNQPPISQQPKANAPNHVCH